MSSISFLDKIELKNNRCNLRNNIKLQKESNPDYRVDLIHDPEVSEVITLVPERKPFTYSDKLQKSIHMHTVRTNINTEQYLHSKKINKSDLSFHAISENSDEKICYAEMLGLQHSLKNLEPVLSSIKIFVTHMKRVLAKLSLHNGLTFITDPLNKLMQKLSNRISFIFIPINPALHNSSMHATSINLNYNDQKMERLRSDINTELMDLHDPNPLVERAFDEMRSPWNILNDNMKSRSVYDFGTKLQNIFEKIRYKSEFNDDFLKEIRTSLFDVNGINISKDPSPVVVLRKMASLIPDYESRQLISAYAHEGIFAPAFLKLMNTYPKLANTYFRNPVVSYKINKIDKDTFKLVATNLVKLDPSFVTDPIIKQYQSFGMRTSVLFSKDHHPSIKSAFFINRI